MLIALILFLPVFGSCHNYAEVHGLIKNLPFSDFITLENVQQIVQNQILEEAKDIVADVESISDGGESVAFKAVISSSEQTAEEMMSKLEKLPTVVPVIWSQLDQPRPKRSVVVSNAYEPYCQNGGTTTDQSTCNCGPYTYGPVCEHITCMNGGRHGNKLRQCVCPPGFEGLYCENRGCRPPVEDNKIGKKRSFVVVLPTVQSMDWTRGVIADTVTTTVNQLLAKEPGYIDNYILGIYYKTNTGQYITSTPYSDVAPFVKDIRTANISLDGAETKDQPTLAALINVMEQNPGTNQTYPNSIILAFTDRLDSDAALETYDPWSGKSQYLNVATDALYWKHKILFYLIQDGQYGAMDQNSEGYNAFRQVARFTHGETFLISQNEVEKILKSDVPFFYKPQNTAVRKYTLCKDIIIDLPRDYPDQYVYVLITSDVNGALVNATTPFYVVPTVADAIITPAVQRTNYAIFSLPGNMTIPDKNFTLQRINSVRVGTIPNVQCSVTAFVSSDYTALLTFAEQDLTDGGSIFNYAEGTNRVTGAQFGFDLDPKKTPYYQPVSLTDGSVIQSSTTPFAGSFRSGCSFGFTFGTQQPCQIGPFTQNVAMPRSTGANIVRHLPGVCVHHQNRAPIIFLNYTTQPTPQNSCYQMNTQDIDEPRLHQFEQIVFVVEISSQMKTAVTNLISILAEVVTDINNSLWPCQYTLITYDQNGWTAQVDDWDAASFAQKSQDRLTLLMQSAVDTENTPLFTGDAVQGAISLKIVSPMIINVFASAQGGLKSSGLQWITPTDVQVNIYQVDENTNAEPSFAFDAQALQLQSSGRYMPITSASISSMGSLLTSSAVENNLIYSGALQNCSDMSQFYAIVEKSATAFTLVVVGRDVGARNNRVSVRVGNNPFPESKIRVMAKSPNALAWRMIPQDAIPGNWTIFVSTTSGPCYVQARVESGINMAIGFSSDPKSDVPSKIPYLRAATDGKPFQVVARVVPNPVVLDRVVLEDIPVEAQWNTTLYQSSMTQGTFTMRDENQCVYQFISSQIYQPLSWDLKVDLKVSVFGRETVGGTEYQFQRVFWYSTYPGLCKGGKTKPNGQCSCDPGYTGEFCFDPICYAGASNNGVCACADGYTGENCKTTYNLTSFTPSPTDGGTRTTTPKAAGSSLTFLTALVMLITKLLV